MSEIDKDYKKVKEYASAFILACIFMLWWAWCKEKPIRFVYCIVVVVILHYIVKYSNPYYDPNNPFMN